MSPYENLPDSQWKKVTKKLVNEHPLSSDILIDTVLEAWNGILKTKIADVIIPGLSEPPVRTLRATIPENGSHIFR